MKKKRGLITTVCMTLAVLIVGGVGFFIWQSMQPEIPTEQKEKITGHAMWPYYDFSGAVDASAVIVYGKSGEAGNTQKFWGKSGDNPGDYYREVPMEAIQVLKGEARSDNTVYCIEPGGETRDKVYELEGTIPFEAGKEYVLFLAEEGWVLAPEAMIPVENGMITTHLVPSASEEAESDDSTDTPVTMPVEDYLTLIEKELEK